MCVCVGGRARVGNMKVTRHSALSVHDVLDHEPFLFGPFRRMRWVGEAWSGAHGSPAHMYRSLHGNERGGGYGGPRGTHYLLYGPLQVMVRRPVMVTCGTRPSGAHQWIKAVGGTVERRDVAVGVRGGSGGRGSVRA